MESTLYVFFPDGVFLYFDHGLDFDMMSLLRVIIQSINPCLPGSLASLTGDISCAVCSVVAAVALLSSIDKSLRPFSI